ncbi:MAG: hypothetical protein QNJ81_00800 [Acidimicrobiia bacterium]|nr:hypothetical protein [Acidimicrobiia bacterium]
MAYAMFFQDPTTLVEGIGDSVEGLGESADSLDGSVREFRADLNVQLI